MRRVLDLLLPPSCPGCGHAEVVLCARCRRALGRRLAEPAGTPLGLPTDQPAGLVQLEWCCSYTGPVRAAVHVMKYDGELRLVRPLAQLMAERWQRVAVGGDMLVPVPVHLHRRRQRGFDQAELLATLLGRTVGMPAVNALYRQTPTRAQHELGRTARAQNVGRAFGVRPGCHGAISGRWIVLVDDVVTTGATLAACASVLAAAGARAVSAIALARER